MNKRNTWVTVIATAAWLGFCGAAAADVAEIVKSCDGCHTGNGDLPAIAGLSEFYQSDQLYFYRDEERPCIDTPDASGETTNMCAVAADLSDDQIDEIAAHYAAMPFVAAKQDFDATLAAAGNEIHDRDCAVCHSDGGSNVADDSGILAGQPMGYLKMTFDQYRAGEREQPDPMKKKVTALSDDDVNALLHYYASQQ